MIQMVSRVSVVLLGITSFVMECKQITFVLYLNWVEMATEWAGFYLRPKVHSTVWLREPPQALI